MTQHLTKALQGEAYQKINLTMSIMLSRDGFLDVIPVFPFSQFVASALFKNDKKKTA